MNGSMPSSLMAAFDRQVEQHVRIGAHGEPAVARDFVFQLTRAPAGVADGDQHALRTGAVGDGFEHVDRGGEGDVGGNLQGRGIAAGRRMQYEAAVVLHRAAEHDRLVHHAVAQPVGDFQVDPIEQHLHRHVGGLVDDDAEHALVVVLANIDDGAAEDRIVHRRHRDQEMIGQVQGRRRDGRLVQTARAFLGHTGHDKRLADLTFLHAHYSLLAHSLCSECRKPLAHCAV
jgi:hypothetical protein